MKKYSLSGKERIKSKKVFDQIFNSGKVIYSKDKKLKAIFFYESNIDKPGLKIAAAVSKKAGNAVWRNRIKRLIRESYRLKKHILIPDLLEKQLLLYLIFSPSNLNENTCKTIYLKDLLSPVTELIKRIKNEL